MGRETALRLLLGLGLLIAGTTSSIYLFHCRHIECDSLVNCAGKWGQETKCGGGHKFKCPPPPMGPGEH